LYELTAGRLWPVKARGVDGRLSPIILATTLKSGWKMAGQRPGHTVIHQLFCRPDFDHKPSDPNADTPFLLIYITYRFDGRVRRTARREISGFWENEGDFPAASEFPTVSAQGGTER
jgi:hypothetical protein